MNELDQLKIEVEKLRESVRTFHLVMLCVIVGVLTAIVAAAVVSG